MNLEEFVTESLAQVFRGVKAAKPVAEETGAGIDPSTYGTLQDIEFDVAVTVTEGSDVKGGIAVMGLGLKGATAESSSTVTRIRFRVPVSLPR